MFGLNERSIWAEARRLRGVLRILYPDANHRTLDFYAYQQWHSRKAWMRRARARKEIGWKL